MIAFVLFAAALAIVAIVLVTRPLWWRVSMPSVSDDARAMTQARDELRQIDALHGSGTLTDAQATEARMRLEQRLGSIAAQTAPVAGAPQRAGALLPALTGFVILVAAGGYALLGTPQALDPQARAAAAGNDDGSSHGITMEQIEGMAEKLAARLKDQPNDPDGWAMLGRSYAVLGKHPQALPAFKQALEQRPDDPVLIADYADALAVVNGRNLEGEPNRLIARALEIDPNNLKALSLAGTAAFVRKDYPLALRHWEKMVQVSPDSDFVKQIQGGIDEARSLAGGAVAQPASPLATAQAAAPAATAKAAGTETISGVVKLAASLAGKAGPEDTLFVYARAAQGSRMPLAIVRKRVKDLPLSFALDDSMAMSPAARLSSAQQVVVSARISKRGEATPQPGDLLGQSAPVAPGTRGLTVEIAQVVAQ